MIRSTFLHETFNHGRFYELSDNDLDMPAMFLQIIKNVCRKIITSAANIWSTTVWICPKQQQTKFMSDIIAPLN